MKNYLNTNFLYKIVILLLIIFSYAIDVQNSIVNLEIEGNNCLVNLNNKTLYRFDRYINSSLWFILKYGQNSIASQCLNPDSGELYNRTIIFNLTAPFEFIQLDNKTFALLSNVQNFSCNQTNLLEYVFEWQDNQNVVCNINSEYIEYNLSEVSKNYTYVTQSFQPNLTFRDNSSIIIEDHVDENFCNILNRTFENLIDFIYIQDESFGCSSPNRLNIFYINNSKGVVHIKNLSGNVNIEMINSNVTIYIAYRPTTDFNITALNSSIILIVNPYYNNYTHVFRSKLNNSILYIYNLTLANLSYNLDEYSYIESKNSNFIYNKNIDNIGFNIIYAVKSNISINNKLLNDLKIVLEEGSIEIFNSLLNNSDLYIKNSSYQIISTNLSQSYIHSRFSNSSIEDVLWTGNRILGMVLEYSNANIQNTKICGMTTDIVNVSSFITINNLTCNNAINMVCSNRCDQQDIYKNIIVRSNTSINNSYILVRFDPNRIPNYRCGNGIVGIDRDNLLETYVSGCNGEALILFKANLSNGTNIFKFYYNLPSQYNQYNDNNHDIEFNTPLNSDSILEISFWFDPIMIADRDEMIINISQYINLTGSKDGIEVYYQNKKIAKLTDPTIYSIIIGKNQSLEIYSNRILVTNVSLETNLEGEYPRITRKNTTIFTSIMIYPQNYIIGNLEYQNLDGLEFSVISEKSQNQVIVYFELPYNQYREYFGDCKGLKVYQENSPLITYAYCDLDFDYALIGFMTNLNIGNNSFKLVFQDVEQNMEFNLTNTSDSFYLSKNAVIISKINRTITEEYLYGYSYVNIYRYDEGTSTYESIYAYLSSIPYCRYNIMDLTNMSIPMCLFIDYSYQSEDGYNSDEYAGNYLSDQSRYNLSNPVYNLKYGYYKYVISNSSLKIYDPTNRLYWKQDFRITNAQTELYIGGDPEDLVFFIHPVAENYNIVFPKVDTKIIDIHDIENRELGYNIRVNNSNNIMVNPILIDQDIQINNTVVFGQMIINGTNIHINNLTIIGRGGKIAKIITYKKNLSCFVGGSNIGYGGSPIDVGYKALTPNMNWELNEDSETDYPLGYNGGWLIIYGNNIHLKDVSLSGHNGGAGGGILVFGNNAIIDDINVSGGDGQNCIAPGGGGYIYLNITNNLSYTNLEIRGGIGETDVAGSGVIYIVNNIRYVIFNNMGQKTNKQSYLPISYIEELYIINGSYVEALNDIVANNVNIDNSILSSPAYPYNRNLKIMANTINITSTGQINTEGKIRYFDDIKGYVSPNSRILYITLLHQTDSIDLMANHIILDGLISTSALGTSSRYVSSSINISANTTSGNGTIFVASNRLCFIDNIASLNGMIIYNVIFDDFTGEKIYYTKNRSCQAGYYFRYKAGAFIKNGYARIGDEPILLPIYNVYYDPSLLSFNSGIVNNTHIAVYMKNQSRMLKYDYINSNVIIVSPNVDIGNSLILNLENLTIYNSSITSINTLLFLISQVANISFSNISSYIIDYRNERKTYSNVNYYKMYGKGAGIYVNYYIYTGASYGGITNNIVSYSNWYSYNPSFAYQLALFFFPKTYGDIRYPLDQGSISSSYNMYSSGYAGGVLYIDASNISILNSRISAVAPISGGTGGSILINSTNMLLRNSLINASGSRYRANSYTFIDNGGGRIAIYYSNLSLNNSNIEAKGGGLAGAGTIFFYNKTSNKSSIMVINHFRESQAIKYSGFTPLYLDFDVDDIYVYNAKVYIRSNNTIKNLVLVNSSLSHPPYPLSKEDQHLELSIINMYVENSIINVSGSGDLFGPGYRDGSYGSYGGLGLYAPANSRYGVDYEPIYLGSGYGNSYYFGGGRVEIAIANLNGSILRIDATGDYGSSGGSILIYIQNTTSILDLMARGGTYGGGGRIAIYRGDVNDSNIRCDVRGGHSNAGASGTCFYGDIFYLEPIRFNEGPFQQGSSYELELAINIYNRTSRSFNRITDGNVWLSIGNQNVSFILINQSYLYNMTFIDSGKNKYFIYFRPKPNYAIRKILYEPIVHGYIVNVSYDKPIYMPNEIATATISIFKYPDNSPYVGIIDLYYKGVYLDSIQMQNGLLSYAFNVGNIGGYHEFNVVFNID